MRHHAAGPPVSIGVATGATPTDCTSMGSYNQQLRGYQTYLPAPAACSASSRQQPPPLQSSSPSSSSSTTASGGGVHLTTRPHVGRSTSSGDVTHARHPPPTLHAQPDRGGVVASDVRNRGGGGVGRTKINGTESYSLPYNLASLAINPNNDNNPNNAFVAAVAGDPLLASPYDLAAIPADAASLEQLIQSSNNGVVVQNLMSPLNNSDSGVRLTGQTNGGPQLQSLLAQRQGGGGGGGGGGARVIQGGGGSGSGVISSRDGAIFASAYAQQLPPAYASSRTGSLPPPQNSSSLKSVMSSSSSSHRNPNAVAAATLSNALSSQMGHG